MGGKEDPISFHDPKENHFLGGLGDKDKGRMKTQYVRVQLLGMNWLHLAEVEVFDQNSVNVALNKVATQSSTACEASAAVDGDKDYLTHTRYDLGKYH